MENDPAVSKKQSMDVLGASHLLMTLAWIVSCIFLLVSFLEIEAAAAGGEHGLKFFLEMLVISFPSGYVVAFLRQLLIPLNGDIQIGSMNFLGWHLGIIIDWFLMNIAGYIQWFIIVPLFFRKLYFYVFKKN